MADFYFKAKKLVIEIDGSAHDAQKEYDAGRDRWLLHRYGVRTVRITNAQELRQSDETALAVLALLL